MRRISSVLLPIHLASLVDISIMGLVLSSSALLFAETGREGIREIARSRDRRADVAALKAVLDQSRSGLRVTSRSNASGSREYSYCYFIPYGASISGQTPCM